MKTHPWTLLSLPLAVTGALFVFGCEGKQAVADAADKEATAGEGAEVAADDAACAALSTKLCDQAGDTSPTCDAVKKTTALLSPKACAAGLADVEYSLSKLDEVGKVCTDLSEKLCAALGTETQTCKMVKEQTPRMPPEQCESMMAEYDKVLGELERMEAKNKPLPADKIAEMSGGGAPAFGPADATVTVVAFSDFQCPYCSKAAEAVTQIKEKYADKARVVFRQFPLSFHQEAHLAAQASLAAHEQGKFWAYHDKLFANQQALGREDLEKYAKELGLNMGDFKKALDDKTYAKQVDDELALGQEVFVDGTPTMFVNGVRVPNSTDIASITQAIDTALAAG